jgi:hypothetical protein
MKLANLIRPLGVRLALVALEALVHSKIYESFSSKVYMKNFWNPT